MGARQRGNDGTQVRSDEAVLRRPGIDRRGFLVGLGLAAGAGALAACGVSDPAGGPSSAARRPYNTLAGPDMSGAAPGVRAQDDLFRHVNGAWYDGYTMPADKVSTGAMEIMGDEVEQQLKEIVESIRDPRAGSDEAKIRDVYRTYLDTAAIEAAGTGPIRPMLAAIDGAADRAALFEVMAAQERSDNGWGIVASAIGPDGKDSTRTVVTLAPTGGALQKDQYTDPQSENIRAAYRTYLRTTARLAALPDPEATATRIFDLESRLAAETWAPEKYRDPTATYNPYKWEQLADLAPGYDWIRWRDLQGIRADVSQDVVLVQPGFLTAAARIWAETDLETLKDRARMTIVQNYSSVLPAAFRDADFQLAKVLQGVERQPERWKDAIGLLNGGLGEALGRLYVDKHFAGDAKHQAERLVTNIKSAFRTSFEQSPWMTPPTRSAAIVKLDKISTKIGYPDKWEDYTKLTTDPASAVGNLRALAMFANERSLDELSKPVDRSKWSMVPQTVNAQYDPTRNEICFPAAILQKPFYSPDSTAAVNYGAIGAVIGHEIGHAFDDSGSRYDGDGNLRDWWAPQDRAEFDKRAKAVIAQYDVLVPTGLGPGDTVNGELTVGENLADLGGLSVAIKAFRIAVANRDEGTEFADRDGAAAASSSAAAASTSDAVLVPLFLSYSRSWQSKTRPETAKEMLATDPHAPEELRVTQVVKNLDAFVAAFGVRPGDGEWLAPEERVTLW
ncbi:MULTISPECIES: M13 family metallopeptidase [Tsukamurella]|uniref:M13 family metallopeptidase n=2 Tax=Tsukamurella TaxID=2060 RepID=A0A5C5S1M9_9ACTN|nr:MULTISPECIES: M13 family metallopeptidase [Tsukamurella]NMD54701.1 M13 family metallopeptidase [Tsukamurella columbiensis]TWS28610.1 M13 family metallopeptidase [Tsukamurella conjunctivitidis]